MSTTHQQRRSTERFWRGLLRQWRCSGLSVRAFCAQQQVSEPGAPGDRSSRQGRESAGASPAVPIARFRHVAIPLLWVGNCPEAGVE